MANKILIIEDDPLVSRMYQKALGFEKLDVETAGNGRIGVEKAKKLKPSLILCDVMMPEMNGMEVLEHLKADPETAGIPVIMLTNLSGTHDAETAMQKGAFAYMVKSEYKPRDVAQTVKNTLGGGEQVAQPTTMMNAAAGQAPAQAAPAPAPQPVVNTAASAPSNTSTPTPAPIAQPAESTVPPQPVAAPQQANSSPTQPQPIVPVQPEPPLANQQQKV